MEGVFALGECAFALPIAGAAVREGGAAGIKGRAGGRGPSCRRTAIA